MEMGIPKERYCSLVFPFFFFIFRLIFCVSLLPLSVHGQCGRSPVIFNFGDSNSDTGGLADGLGRNFSFPNGRTYFRQPAGRLSDGRLMIDFLCDTLNSSYLSPYLNSLGPNFTNGANFAICGSATLPRSVPFNLDVQVSQFLRFRARSPTLMSNGYKDLVGEGDIQNALYMIDIGQNDIGGSFDHLTYSQVIDKIPSFITEIKSAIWNLYQSGAKNFWVHNTGPLGCLPEKLARFGQNISELDEHGCLKPLNNAAKTFNAQLLALCQQLRTRLINATIVYVDIYSIKYDLIANAPNNGFQSPLMACCGSGGPPYNYNGGISCGRTGYTVCDEGSKFISWDGVHYTEAANAVFASKILSTNYSTPRVNFNFFCNKVQINLLS